MKTILLADDEPHLVMLLQHHLRNANYTLEIASSGEEALAKAQAHRIDLMIIDIDLPGIDGIETLCRLKKLPGYSQLPVFVMTGGSGDGTRERATAAGATAFFNKPYSPKGLLHQVALLFPL